MGKTGSRYFFRLFIGAKKNQSNSPSHKTSNDTKKIRTTPQSNSGILFPRPESNYRQDPQQEYHRQPSFLCLSSSTHFDYLFDDPRWEEPVKYWY